jgi:hypothetical protein
MPYFLEIIRHRGYERSDFMKNIKEKWEKFINKIADQNKSTYGEGKLHCCELKKVTEGRDIKK